MSEQDTIPTEEENIPSELESLKERATQMGINFAANIGVDKLRARVNDKLNGTSTEEELGQDKPQPTEAQQAAPAKRQKTKAELHHEFVLRCRKEANVLVRVVVHNMNPNKKDWPGEIITVSNSVVGTLKKYVPFNVEAGYHVPQMILNVMQDRQYQKYTKKPIAGGRTKVVSSLAPEFNIQVLPPLTKDEMQELATRQALNHSIQED
jgi:hypothetical protein